ncbi:MAG: radical SAM protein, partial [Nanobdellota archaeon]
MNKKYKLVTKILSRLDYNSSNFDISKIKYYFGEESNFAEKEIITSWQKFLKNGGHEVNLYIHVPFCKKKCFYCREDSTAAPDRFDETNYLDYLLKRIDSFKEIFKDKTINSLYIGGGTPSLLSEEAIKLLLKKLQTSFSIKNDGEKTFEANPESLTKKKIDIISNSIINRLSMGVQSTNEYVVKKNGRLFVKKQKIKQLIEYAKNKKFEAINVDLIMGLFGDTPEYFIQSLKDIAQIGPSDIFVYPLNPTERYIKTFYKNDSSFFFKEFDKLVDKINLSELERIAHKYGYCDYSTNITNKIGIYFSKDENKKTNKQQNKYEFIKDYPSSCLGIGKHAQSRIVNHLRYSDGYNADLLDFSPNYIGKKINGDYEFIENLERKIKFGKI